MKNKTWKTYTVKRPKHTAKLYYKKIEKLTDIPSTATSLINKISGEDSIITLRGIEINETFNEFLRDNSYSKSWMVLEMWDVMVWDVKCRNLPPWSCQLFFYSLTLDRLENKANQKDMADIFALLLNDEFTIIDWRINLPKNSFSKCSLENKILDLLFLPF